MWSKLNWYMLLVIGGYGLYHYVTWYGPPFASKLLETSMIVIAIGLILSFAKIIANAIAAHEESHPARRTRARKEL